MDSHRVEMQCYVFCWKVALESHLQIQCFLLLTIKAVWELKRGSKRKRGELAVLVNSWCNPQTCCWENHLRQLRHCCNLGPYLSTSSSFRTRSSLLIELLVILSYLGSYAAGPPCLTQLKYPTILQFCIISPFNFISMFLLFMEAKLTCSIWLSPSWRKLPAELRLPPTLCALAIADTHFSTYLYSFLFIQQLQKLSMSRLCFPPFKFYYKLICLQVFLQDHCFCVLCISIFSNHQPVIANGCFHWLWLWKMVTESFLL